MKNYKTAADAVCELILAGYSIDFSSGVNKQLSETLRTSIALPSDDFKIDEMHHFAAKQGSEEEIFVFAISSQLQGKRGIIVSPYATRN